MSTDITKSIRNTAITLLSKREYAVAELANKLTNKYHDAEAIIQSVLTALQKENLLSETRFVQAYITSKQNRGYGPVAIKMMLKETGAAEDIVDEYICLHDSMWQEMAKAYREKKFGHKALRDIKEKARQIRHLRYKGFTQSQINYALQVDK